MKWSVQILRAGRFGAYDESLYNTWMANRAYASVWVRGFDEASMSASFERLLSTVPLSVTPPGFTGLVIRAVDFTEPLLEDYDLRSVSHSAADVAALAREHADRDVAYEVSARWDLWVRDSAEVAWKQRPEPLEIACYGPEYDSGVSAESGNFLADIGFEHLFTGHAGLLAASRAGVEQREHVEEARFLAWMSRPENLREYHEKTRENVQKLMDWMRAIEDALPLERFRLWSEGEENFEARLDEILAVR